MVEAPVNLENEKKKNIRLALGVASFGVIAFFCIYIIFFAIIFFSPWTFFNVFPIPSFAEGVVGLDGNLFIISKSFDFKGASYEQPPREKMTLRIYDGKSLSEPEEIKPFASLYHTENKIYFFDKGLYRTFDMKTWEEFKNPEIGSNPKGAVGTDGIWVLSTMRKKPVLRLITERETKEIPLPDDELVEEMYVCSSQLLCLENELHLFWKTGIPSCGTNMMGRNGTSLKCLKTVANTRQLSLKITCSLYTSGVLAITLKLLSEVITGIFGLSRRLLIFADYLSVPCRLFLRTGLLFFNRGCFLRSTTSLKENTLKGHLL